MTNTIKKIDTLENQVTELLNLYQHLKGENEALHSQLNNLRSERSHLLEQKEKARSQVESMITRLRSLEHA